MGGMGDIQKQALFYDLSYLLPLAAFLTTATLIIGVWRVRPLTANIQAVTKHL